jgi:GNAT superfamily N-acetyltransferase
MAVTVRSATPADRDLLLAFHRALYIDHRDAVVPQQLQPLYAYRDFERVLREDVRSLCRDPNSLVRIAEKEGQPVGYATGHIEVDSRRVLPRKGIVEDWYVTPEARGHGVGRVLLDALMEEFRQGECDIVESATWSSNEDARRAHDRLGFSEVQVTYRKRLR